MRALVLLLGTALGIAEADEGTTTPPPLIAPPPTQRARPPLAEAATPQARLSAALARFDFGDYEGVIAELASLIDAGGARALPGADRLEALRAYAIACVLVDRPTAAEGAFLLLLEADPGARLDRRLVRPEAVAVFEAVRARNRDTLWSAYKKGRGRRYAILNLLPPGGQLQNRQYTKAYALLGTELTLLGLNIVSGSLLYAWQGEHKDFPDHAEAARSLRPLNWVSFGALIAVITYGIIDGFVVGAKRTREERRVEDSLRAGVGLVF